MKNALGYYNLSLQGTSHSKSGIPCQDSSHITLLENGWAVAVIADGLGAAKHSDVGAYLATGAVVDHMTEFCVLKSEWNVPDLMKALRESYKVALKKINEKAAIVNISPGEYDTTLTTAVYNGSKLVFAHVGDGGIVTLSKKGDFSLLTKPQKGEEFNMVSPLRSENKWVFGSSALESDDICAFAMLTDGIYDVVCPWLLANQEQPIYVNYIRPFMDRNLLKVSNQADFDKIRKEIKLFLNSEYNAKITDDKTIATVINMDYVPAVKSDKYYAEPEWERLQNEHRKKLYSKA
jgi:serine/threonine protein phosphatase PrpC